MCDTFVVMPSETADGAVWFGKNSDREPGEAQLVESIPGKKHTCDELLQCTHISIPQLERTNEVLISRPFWMWGCEMGINEHGLAIGNQAVFTKIPIPESGLTGMDLVRLALERASEAREALELIVSLIQEFGQGGRSGYRDRQFRYHNAFIIADASEAWVLETAGKFWAASKVQGIRSISNSLSIGTDFDLVSDDAYGYAVSQGWSNSALDFDFAKSFGSPLYRVLAGGEKRRACTTYRLNSRAGQIGFEECAEALRDHGGLAPEEGWRMDMPCAHASWWPTRHSGQTTGSMLARLTPDESVGWWTGTSSPCLSVFKPIPVGEGQPEFGPAPTGEYDPESLFWRHERLHRLCLLEHSSQKKKIEEVRLALERSLSEGLHTGEWREGWARHRAAILDWLPLIESELPERRIPRPFDLYWEKQKRLDHFPATL